MGRRGLDRYLATTPMCLLTIGVFFIRILFIFCVYIDMYIHTLNRPHAVNLYAFYALHSLLFQLQMALNLSYSEICAPG